MAETGWLVGVLLLSLYRAKMDGIWWRCCSFRVGASERAGGLLLLRLLLRAVMAFNGRIMDTLPSLLLTDLHE